MLVSCICVCHNKPEVTQEAIQSIINQSYPHWEAIIVDSGMLYDAGYYDRFVWRQDPRVKLIRSEETDEIRRTRAMAPWCFNECFRKGRVSGDLVLYLCDDDLLYANAFATFVAYCHRNPHAQAMYASQDLAVIYPNGWRALVGERRATAPGGRCCNGRRMDCHVDYLQFCHNRDVLRLLAPDAYWPEGKESESHADGIFMERIGEQVPIYPIDVKVSQNRRTSQSTYVPVRSFSLIECLANGAPSLASPIGEAAQVRSGPNLLDRTPAAVCDGPVDCSLPSPDDAPLVTISVAFRQAGACLADTLACVAAQTYPHLEVLVIADSTTAGEATRSFEAMKPQYPQFRFLDSTCLDTVARRDRGLWQARGLFFLPLDAGILACPDMAERLVAGLRRNAALSALACYVLAIREESSTAEADVCSAMQEPGLLASTKNLSSNGIFHTADFRKVGGYGIDGEILGQDWIAFHNLVSAGYQVDVLPEHLFYYRRAVADASLDNRDVQGTYERLLRPFFQADRLLAAERVALWTAFAKMQRRLEELTEQNKLLQDQNETLRVRSGALRYQLADRLVTLWNRLPLARRSFQWLRSTRVGNLRNACPTSDQGEYGGK
jgi:glycosyltransferase involved in cell wall biosynthesis